MKFSNIIYAILIIIFSTACRKKIDLKFKDSAPKNVIQCEINDTDSIHYVTITKSLGLNGAATYSGVTGAIITLKDQQGNTTTFLDLGDGKYQSGVYFLTNNFTYTLSVNVNGEDFIATSTLPTHVNLEDLVFLPSGFGDENARIIVPLRYDPENEANFYRFKVTINDTVDKSIQIQDDELSNGLLQQQPIFGGEFPVVGDTCEVTLNCIDKNVFDYLFTLLSNDPGGSATPANPKSNFSGGCLGFFSAQAKNTLVRIAE